MIKDSGERTEFSTGAVRDMRKGKGRCDLMPLKVVSVIINSNVICAIANYINENDKGYLYVAISNFIRESKSNIYDILLRLAVHFEEGANKYGEYNWQKGIPERCYIDSAIRHYLKYKRGDTDEPHDIAFIWNIVCLIWTVENIKSE